MIVDLGCGTNKVSDEAVGLDHALAAGPDVACDLGSAPWPLRDNVATQVHLSHIIEHMDDPFETMNEVHRIAKPGARVYIKTPHFSSHNSFVDPTHRRHFSYFSFDYFTGKAFERFLTSSYRFEIIERRLTFGRNFVLDGFGRFLAKRNIRWYEARAAWVFPARDIECTLRVIK
jgi:hypothetical protein